MHLVFSVYNYGTCVGCFLALWVSFLSSHLQFLWYFECVAFEWVFKPWYIDLLASPQRKKKEKKRMASNSNFHCVGKLLLLTEQWLNILMTTTKKSNKRSVTDINGCRYISIFLCVVIASIPISFVMKTMHNNQNTKNWFSS